MSRDSFENLERDGFTIVADLVGPDEIDKIVEAVKRVRPGSRLEREGEVYASRNLLADLPEVRRLANGPALSGIARSILGPDAFAVRGLLFDKTPSANWGVPWHQDLTIAIRKRVDAPGFGPWTVKGGVPHVRPPAGILERMVTIRLQLDDDSLDNGPLRVVPGSHRAGRLDASTTQAWLERNSVATCLVPRGGALVMRPLLLHASSPTENPGHRRVIHLEYAAESLPLGVEWYEEPD